MNGDSESAAAPVTSTNKISSCFTTTIELDDDVSIGSETECENDIFQMSFLLAIFDNIVGPKVIHFWQTKSKTNSSSVKNSKKRAIDDQLLKYIAIHTLNGELYQDKLINHLKFRLYLIKEIEYAVFSVFFDASTITTLSYGSSNCSDDFMAFDELNVDSNNADNSVISSSPENVSISNRNVVATSLNCFSVIVPLDKKDILLKNYGLNTAFFINSFENMILEYKVFAQIKPKVRFDF